MIILKWVSYILALGAFIWYIFLRKTDLSLYSDVDLQEETISQLTLDSSENFNYDDSLEYTEESEYLFLDDTSENIVYEEDVNIPEEVEEFETESMDYETDIEIQEEVVSESVNTDASFLLIVGSFGNKNNANRLLNKVKNEYPRSTVTFLNGLNRVVVSSYDNEEDAKSAKAQYLRNTGGSAFVLAQ